MKFLSFEWPSFERIDRKATELRLGNEIILRQIEHSKLKLEVWKSSENREERHFFINDFKPTAYQQSPYVFGYNPQVVSEEQVKQIIAILNAVDAK